MAWTARHYQWVDLDGEGLSGILTEQADGWFYKRNLSPSTASARTAPNAPRRASLRSNSSPTSPAARLAGRRQQFLDLAGDGQLDLVAFDGPCQASTSARTTRAGSRSALSLAAQPRHWDDPNLKFVDLDGDGHADILITEDEVFPGTPRWPRTGFGPAERVRQPCDEEKGPRLVFADGTQSIYLADMSRRRPHRPRAHPQRRGLLLAQPRLRPLRRQGHDGQRALVRRPDQFDQRRIRLADIDGSGVTDIIYLGRDGVASYFNQSGNSWSAAAHVDAVSRASTTSPR